jgi:4-aminobutyrate aminotransferase-like enzyme/Ser/Thr protein kinase RdoA (MazF antagonist)
MMPEARIAAPISSAEAAHLAQSLYSLDATAQSLPGEYDDNFHLTASNSHQFVLKLMHPARKESFVDMQCRALAHLANHAPHLHLPRVIPTPAGALFTHATLPDNSVRLAWLLSYVPGTPLAKIQPHTPALLSSFGQLLAELDIALQNFSHPAVHRDFKWDLSRSGWARDYLRYIADPHRRSLAKHFLNLFEQEAVPCFPHLRRSVIYGDANDYNALVDPQALRVTSVIDFGDMHHTITVAEPAIAAAYSILGEDDPLAVAATLLTGYQQIFPLSAEELAAFFPLMAARLAVSVINSAHRKSLIPDDPYITVTEAPAYAALERLSQIDPPQAHEFFRSATSNAAAAFRLPVAPASSRPAASDPSNSDTNYFTYDQTLSARKKLLGANLSLSYDHPLKITRGFLQHLYDDTGRAYLDLYNNVPLVGHSHPRVVHAIQHQIAQLNTNTRYLHDNILLYAERLTSLLPAPLKICYFLNSGSEANELALRLARTHTHREDIIVLEHAYHGHTTTLIDISPYKFNGPGGTGKKPWVHVAPIADSYRGLYRRGESDPRPTNLAQKYSAHVAEILENTNRAGKPAAAFIAETLPSVAGQIVFPPDYLSEVYKHVRAAGAVCIADEVQVGFGRLGTHFWGFETQNVIPDIVVLGKPIGNAFPLAAVITTPEIAASFANGMEFFSTFGGNPVACAAGLAVLDVLRDEHLQQNAQFVGSAWLQDLRSLQSQHALIGDVRGSGLFLGIDLVTDRESRAPATAEAHRIVNELRNHGILAGTDGPHHNVLKLRPPLCITTADTQQFTQALSSLLS